jgi:hypothetical protein
MGSCQSPSVPNRPLANPKEGMSEQRNHVTKDGWRIRYLVVNDTTQRHDLYIECSKDSVKRIYEGIGLLDYHPNFIPTFAGENEDCLFFTHACAQGCSAILTFHKKEKQYHDYDYLVAFDLEASAIVFVPQQDDFSPLKLKVADLKKKTETEVLFKNRCMGMMFYKSGCVETVHFSKRTIDIHATLMDVNDENRDRVVQEVQKINL